MKSIVFFIVIALISCTASESNKTDNSESHAHVVESISIQDEKQNEMLMPESILRIKKDTDVILKYNGHDILVSIILTDSLSDKNILLLHGWNLPHTEWCSKTNFCQLAREAGYNIIMPNFGKSTYQWEIYPETIEKYRSFPTREWMYDDFIRYCQEKFGMLLPDQNYAVIGLSTGGRGAALFALENPEIFNACVALSADFDQTKIPTEPINTGFYGPYNEFKERWEGRDNIHNRADEWELPVYLGHGTDDKMCPVQQTQLFHARLQELGFENVILSLPKHGHTYDYWGSESENIVSFLKRYVP